jgi:uncharacterized protein (TIGR03437 family)
MKEKRNFHTATLLNNRLVLVTGGHNGSGASKTAELYDPQTGAWRYTKAAMNIARGGHTATLLPNGRVLIAGGGPETNTTEIYDPTTEVFTPAKPMNVARHLHRAILLKDGRVLVVAGRSSSGIGARFATNAAEIYDPATGNWSLTDPLPFAVTDHTATLLSDGKVLVAGGYDGSAYDAHVASVALYDPVSGKWKMMAPMQVRRTYHTATLLTNGKVLIAGGNTTFTTLDSSEIYDPAAGTNGQTTLSGTIKVGGWGSRSVSLNDGSALIVGGEFLSLGSPISVAATAAQIFNPATSTFTDVGPMNAGRAYAALTLLPSGQVLITGGQGSGGTPLESAELLGGQNYDAVRDFSIASNPNGDWSYGYSSTLRGTFTKFTYKDVNVVPGIERWGLSPDASNDINPSVNHNTTNTIVTDTTNIFPPDMLLLHPGRVGQYSIVRWTAPRAGTYRISGAFRGLDRVSSSASTDDHILLNSGTSLFSTTIEDFDEIKPFTLTRAVAAGDTIDFAVGYGSNQAYQNDSTGLSAIITRVGDACTPPSITSHPVSQPISSGQTVTLSVAATGTAPLTYQWYRGQSGDTSSPIAGATSGSYTTPALTSSARFWVRVSNTCGDVNSNAATISLAGKAPTFYHPANIFPPSIPNCGETIDWPVDKVFDFTINAYDEDSRGQFEIRADKLPLRADFLQIPSDRSDGVSFRIIWRPTTDQIGTHALAFIAADSTNLQSRCELKVNIWGDSDGDGLRDDWESNGYWHKGQFVNLPAMGANPYHKDVFVKFDYLASDGLFGHSHIFKAEARVMVTEAFAKAPVSNPDGRVGINLHLIEGDRIVEDESNKALGGTAQNQKYSYKDCDGQPMESTGEGYDWHEFDNIKRDRFSEALSLSHHYAIFGHDPAGKFGFSGIARGKGGDFLITLGSWGETAWRQAITFMHELGHSLGLEHGGGDICQFKPNYLSIMNYSFAVDGVPYNGRNILDYSRFSLPALDENALNESIGLRGGEAAKDYGTRWYCGTASVIRDLCFPSSTKVMTTNNVNAPINWNCNLASPCLNVIDIGSVSANINYPLNKDLNRHAIPGQEKFNKLSSYNDWESLNYKAGRIGAGISLPESMITPAIEIDLDSAKAMVPSPPTGLEGQVSTTSVQLNWEPLGSQDDWRYRVYRSLDGKQYSLLSETSLSVIIDTGLDSGKIYHYYVTSINSLGSESGPSNIITIMTDAADLALTNTASLNQKQITITYVIEVANNGPTPARSVTVTDTLPSIVSFVSCSATGGGVCGGSGNNRIVMFPSLAVNATATVTLTANVLCAASGTQSADNTATISSALPDPNPGNNSATAALNIICEAKSDLTLAGGKTAFAFGPIAAVREPNANPPSDTFAVENVGNAPLTLRFAVSRNDAGGGKITNTDDSSVFPVRLINANGTESSVLGGAQVEIPAGQRRNFRVLFNPLIPNPAGRTNNLFANHVIPDAITSTLTITPNSGSAFTVPLIGRVTTGVRLINALAPRLAPLVALVKSGDEFTVEFSAYDANHDVRAVTYQFLDENNRPVGERVGFDLDLSQSGMLKGQSFTVVQKFTGAGRKPEVNRVEVAVYDREGSDAFVSAPIGTVVGRVVNVSGASFARNAIATESIVSAFGTGMANAAQGAAALPLPTELAGTRVYVRDSLNVERAAPLFYSSPLQINYLMPEGTAPGAATVVVAKDGAVVATETTEVGMTAPAVFTANSTGQGVAAALVQRVRADGSQVFEPVAAYDAAQGKFSALPIDLGPATDQVFLVLFGTGVRHRSSLGAVRARVGGVDVEVLYAGAQGGYAGLDQINLRVPRTLVGSGEVDVVLTADGKAANTVRVAIR